MTKPTVSEAEWQDAVVDLAHIYGWVVAHFRTGRTGSGGYATPVQYDGKGFPDLVLAHPTKGVIFAELKSDKGRMSKPQTTWTNTLHTANTRNPNAGVYIWRPSDLPTVKRILERGPGRTR